MSRSNVSIALAEKLISLAALTLTIELVLFKFLPDLGTAPDPAQPVGADGLRCPFSWNGGWCWHCCIVFYRMLSGNISEFRLLLPVLLPCIYGLAYQARPRSER